MSSLTNCLKKADLSAADKEAIREAQQEYRKDGHSPDTAAEMAVRDAIRALKKEKADISAMLAPKPEPKAAPKPKPEPKAAPKPDKVKQVEDWTAPLKLKWKDGSAPKVTVVPDFKSLPKGIRDALHSLKHAASEKVQALYWHEGKEVFLVASNLGDKRAAMTALAHEAIGHHGMEKVVDNWADVVGQIDKLASSDPRSKAIMADLSSRYGTLDPNTRAREFLALAVERHVNEGPLGQLLARVRAAIRRFLRAVGLKGAFTSAEIDRLILDAASTLREKAPAPKAKGTVSTAVAAAPKPAPKPAPKAAPKPAPKAAPKPPAAGTTPQLDVEASTWNNVRHAMQDRYIYIKKMEGAAPVTPDEAAQSYMYEENYSGRVEERLRHFKEVKVDKLLDDMLAADISIAETDEFRYARHAPEANARLRTINKPGTPGYDKLSGKTDKEAADITNRWKKDPRYQAMKDIVDQIDAIQATRLQILEREGLETADTIKTWRNTYQHYAPLKRDMGAESLMPRVGQGHSIHGKESKSRLGSQRQAVDLLANTIADYEATVIRSEKAKVGRALLKFANDNPDPNFWEVDVPQRRRTKNKKTGLVEWKPVTDYKTHDNVFMVKIDGIEHHIVFNEKNPVAMKLAASFKNLGADNLGAVTKTVQRAMRFLAALNTAYSPEFVLSNLVRDLQTAGYNLGSTDASGAETAILGKIPKAWAGIRAAQKGNYNSQWAKNYRRFTRAGGKVGWIDHYASVEARRSDLEKTLKAKGRSRLHPKSIMKGVVDFVESENTAVENAVRLSAFVHAVDVLGLSERKAASLAKNLTVNFNRKGEFGPMMNTWYLFYNAGVQGNVRMIQAAVKSPRVRKLIGATVAFSFFNDMLQRWIGGDDEDGVAYYDKIPEWVKERNMIIMLDDGDFMKIPLPWGFNVFHVFGRKMSEAVPGAGKDDFNALDASGELVNAILSAFNPLGGEASLLQWLSPTLGDPIVQWAENKSFFGSPLRPEQSAYDVPKPEYRMHWQSVREPSRVVAEQLNNLTGGTEVKPGGININPEAIDLVIDMFTGSAGRFVADSIATPIKAARGEGIEAHTVPMLRKLYGTRSSSWERENFYNYIDEIRYAEKEVANARKTDASFSDIRKLKADPKFKLRYKAKVAKRRVKKLRDEAKALRNDTTMPIRERSEAYRVKEEEMRKAMMLFIKQYRETVPGILRGSGQTKTTTTPPPKSQSASSPTAAPGSSSQR